MYGPTMVLHSQAGYGEAGVERVFQILKDEMVKSTANRM